MAAWTSDELDQLGRVEEMEIAPARADGSLRDPTTIWVVRVGDELYVRSWRGREGAWYASAQENRRGRIRADGVAKDVSFEEALDSDLNDQIDEAYEAKYGRYPQYVRQMVAPEQRSTTLRIVPRDGGASD